MIDGHGDDTHHYSGIRMNFSSNIYAHADLTALEEHLRRHLHLIRSYPEPTPHTLARLIAQREGVDESQVLVTNGATEAIHLVARTFQTLGTFSLTHPTFSEYTDACLACGYHEEPQGALHWLCTPNNPTGTVTPADALATLAREHQLLVLDLSYEDYTLSPTPSASQLLACGNVIALHSMTKQFAVPGLRLGYLIAPADLVRKLTEHYHPWAVNALAIEAGLWLVTHAVRPHPGLPAYLDEAQQLRTWLNAVEGIAVAPTHTNFMLATIAPATAAQLKEHLATQHGILIRDAANFRSLTPHHFRIAAQSPAENEALVAAIQLFLQRL